MDDIRECYRILDLEPGASMDDVKRSYRELVKVWHPDRFRGDPKLQTKAEEKLKRINLAYERLSKEASAAEKQKAASPQPKKPYPERRTTGTRATQAGPSRNTQAYTNRAHQQNAATGGHKAERFSRWIQQPRVSAALVAFIIIVLGMIVAIVQSGRRKNDGLATTLVPKIAKVASERNERLPPVLKVAQQGSTKAEAAYVEAKLATEFEQTRKAAAQGDAAAQHDLGLMYATGTGVPKDEAKAAEWYQKAAAQGDAIAEFNLGGMYYQGRGISKDEVKAFELWLRAADRGSTDAETALVLAFKQYQKAAEQGNARAQSNLGIMYARGRGVPKDEVKAVEWLQKAAVQGIAAAQSELGFMCAEGTGVTKDETKAVELWQKAAAQGDDYALFKLGVMYAEGRGVSKDAGKAIELWRKGAAQGSAIAQYQLGLMSADGRSVQKDGFNGLFNNEKPARPPAASTIAATVGAQKTDDAMLRHLATDDRLVSGSLLVDRLRQSSGKGKLTLDNGLPEDAYVKLILNRKLVAAFYVRSHEKFTFSTIPDGNYSVMYCTGYGWDGAIRNFARGRHARRYDELLTYSTTKAREGSVVTTSTDVMTLTLHKVAYGNAKASDMSLEDFDQF